MKSAKFIRLCKKFGVDPENIPEILTFEDACKATKVDPKKLPVVTGLPQRHRLRIIADYKLTIIAEALRQGNTADYTNTNETKYFPVFKVKADKKRPSGFGLSSHRYVGWNANSTVGVRLCFPSWELAKYFAMQFMKLHIDHQLITSK